MEAKKRERGITESRPKPKTFKAEIRGFYRNMKNENDGR